MPEKTVLQIFLNFTDIIALRDEMNKYSKEAKANLFPASPCVPVGEQ